MLIKRKFIEITTEESIEGTGFGGIGKKVQYLKAVYKIGLKAKRTHSKYFYGNRLSILDQICHLHELEVALEFRVFREDRYRSRSVSFLDMEGPCRNSYSRSNKDIEPVC